MPVFFHPSSSANTYGGNHPSSSEGTFPTWLKPKCRYLFTPSSSANTYGVTIHHPRKERFPQNQLQQNQKELQQNQWESMCFYSILFFLVKLIYNILLNNYTWIKGRWATSYAAKPFCIAKPKFWKTTFIDLVDTTLPTSECCWT
jgi:hypothetical protein